MCILYYIYNRIISLAVHLSSHTKVIFIPACAIALLCSCQTKQVEEVFKPVLPPEVGEHLINSASDGTAFEEAKEICCAEQGHDQSAGKMGQERTYTADEPSDEDEYLCELTELSEYIAVLYMQRHVH